MPGASPPPPPAICSARRRQFFSDFFRDKFFAVAYDGRIAWQ
jgi:hypothetical protein